MVRRDGSKCDQLFCEMFVFLANAVSIWFLTCNVVMCREWSKRLTAEQAQKMYEQATKLEQEFSEYFTGALAVLLIIL